MTGKRWPTDDLLVAIEARLERQTNGSPDEYPSRAELRSDIRFLLDALADARAENARLKNPAFVSDLSKRCREMSEDKRRLPLAHARDVLREAAAALDALARSNAALVKTRWAELSESNTEHDALSVRLRDYREALSALAEEANEVLEAEGAASIEIVRARTRLLPAYARARALLSSESEQG